MFSEKNGKKVDLLKPNHLMQESGAAEDLKKARKLKEDAILKLIYRAEAKVSKSSETAINISYSFVILQIQVWVERDHVAQGDLICVKRSKDVSKTTSGHLMLK